MKLIFPVSLILCILLLLAPACNNPQSQQEAQSRETTADTLSGTDRAAFTSRGQEIARATFAELSGKLGAAMAEGGVANAVQYCSLAAYPLVDSLSEVHNAVIRRTSLKLRNPKNAPSGAELAVLRSYEEQAAAGTELLPRVERTATGAVAFYAPIRVLPLCLQCHGRVGEELKQENYELIRQRYPQDQATGYALNDLRGIWSITFNE